MQQHGKVGRGLGAKNFLHRAGVQGEEIVGWWTLGRVVRVDEVLVEDRDGRQEYTVVLVGATWTRYEHSLGRECADVDVPANDFLRLQINLDDLRWQT
jgi:hypothetical protein